VILVDTTVWIDLFADRETDGTRKLTSCIEDSRDLASCGPVTAEVLHGIRSDKLFEHTRRILGDLIYLPMSQATFVRAAKIYRRCRRKGLTIRKPVDCMIAAVCMENSAFILHNDRDFDRIARHFPVQKC
jgi:hypothetical protein